ncbi:Gfo/Idh/MocA family oxidoreductase [Rossellomorea aquimaris]|uniref:Gfo/Idh/MocA family protein n=1 Tax=Rossellomorea aquimaris TaxID=189382 RepID=UPI0037C6FEB2
MFNLASHTLDILDFLLGPIQEAEGYASNQGSYYEAEDIVTGTYQFESGVQGVGTWRFTAFEEVDVNEIIGSKGKIRFSTFGDDPVTLMTVEGKEQWSFERTLHFHQPLVESIVKELIGSSVSCPRTGDSGARTNWVMDRISGK